MKINNKTVQKEYPKIGDIYENIFGAIMWRTSKETTVCLKPANNYRSKNFEEDDNNDFPYDECLVSKVIGKMVSIDEVTVE